MVMLAELPKKRSLSPPPTAVTALIPSGGATTRTKPRHPRPKQSTLKGPGHDVSAVGPTDSRARNRWAERAWSVAGHGEQNWLIGTVSLNFQRPRSVTPSRRYAPPTTSGSPGRRNAPLQTATVTAALRAAVRLGPRPVVLVRCSPVTGRCEGPDLPLGVRDDRTDPSGPADPVPAAGTTPAVQLEPSPRRTDVSSRVSPCG
jgi:hypothetical protein